MAKTMCCDEATMFGDHCSECERGNHGACSARVAVEEITPEDATNQEDTLSLDGDLGPVNFLPMRERIVVSEPEPAKGAWVVYDTDADDLFIMEGELDALRMALKRKMCVVFLPWGVNLIDAAKEENS